MSYSRRGQGASSQLSFSKLPSAQKDLYTEEAVRLGAVNSQPVSRQMLSSDVPPCGVILCLKVCDPLPCPQDEHFESSNLTSCSLTVYAFAARSNTGQREKGVQTEAQKGNYKGRDSRSLAPLVVRCTW